MLTLQGPAAASAAAGVCPEHLKAEAVRCKGAGEQLWRFCQQVGAQLFSLLQADAISLIQLLQSTLAIISSFLQAALQLHYLLLQFMGPTATSAACLDTLSTSVCWQHLLM
jgi:hypothetical protein